jgi:hypothetical protein
MAHWIEQKAAQLKAQEEDALKRRAGGAEIVDQLETMVRRDVEKWNELNPGYRRRIDGVIKSMSSGGFQVRKTSFPPATVDAILAADSFSVKLKSIRLRLGCKEPCAATGRFDLKPAANGRLCFATHSGEPISLEEASQFLLEPIIETIG